MNIILLDKKDFDTNTTNVVLNDRRFDHIKTIIKPAIGDRLSTGLLNDKLGEAEILELTDKQVRLRVDFNTKPPPSLQCKLILALPRPIVLKRILASITTLGIKEIYLIQSNRVEKSYWGSPVLEDAQLEHYMRLGLEQAKDTILPKIYFKKRFKTFVQDELPKIIKGTKAFFAHPEEGKTPHKHSKPVTLVIGPEGGFNDFEIDLLKQAGLSGIHLGKRILKVETAITALISQVCL